MKIYEKPIAELVDFEIETPIMGDGTTILGSEEPDWGVEDDF